MTTSPTSMITTFDADWNCPQVDLVGLAKQYGTPIYVYQQSILERQVGVVDRALAATAATQHRIQFAVKSNRYTGVLRTLKASGLVGIDACSPREVELALEHGWSPDQITVTVSMVSNADLKAFAAFNVHMTLDKLSAMRRYAAIVPKGTAIGIRIDTLSDMGYGTGEGSKFSYAAGKMGIHPSEAVAAVEYARSLGLVVDEIHVHPGWALQQKDVASFEAAITRGVEVAKACGGIKRFNVGGGLTVTLKDDHPLHVDQWSASIRRCIVNELPEITVVCEIGTFISHPSGVMITEVTTIEKKQGINWLGVDSGMANNVFVYLYHIPMQVYAIQHLNQPATEHYNIGSNINEAKDGFGNNIALPLMAEEELLALYPAGAYGATMQSDHCLRGKTNEVMINSDGSIFHLP